MNEKELAAEKEWDEFFALNREDSDEEKKSCDEGFIAPPAEDEEMRRGQGKITEVGSCFFGVQGGRGARLRDEAFYIPTRPPHPPDRRPERRFGRVVF